MPTTRPRYSITETDAVARLLDDAAKRWPGESRSTLLVRLAEEGHRALKEHDEGIAEERRTATHRTSGALTGVYEDGYLVELRRDWPE